jgi:hypothetical protein
MKNWAKRYKRVAMGADSGVNRNVVIIGVLFTGVAIGGVYAILKNTK